jgi:hypothetical protein
MLDDIDHTEFIINCDNDDFEMTDPITLTELLKYKNTVFYHDNNKTKIEAINRNIDRHLDNDIILLASDDMIPVKQGYDKYIRMGFDRYIPDNDGILWFNDGHQQNRLNTLAILGNTYYKRFGYIYHPSYKSLYCDLEFTMVGNHLKKQIYVDNIIIEHRHHSSGQATNDQLYQTNEKYHDEDQLNFKQRRDKYFGL